MGHRWEKTVLEVTTKTQVLSQARVLALCLVLSKSLCLPSGVHCQIHLLILVCAFHSRKSTGVNNKMDEG